MLIVVSWIMSLLMYVYDILYNAVSQDNDAHSAAQFNSPGYSLSPEDSSPQTE
jgi:hypothetical protein